VGGNMIQNYPIAAPNTTREISSNPAAPACGTYLYSYHTSQHSPQHETIRGCTASLLVNGFHHLAKYRTVKHYLRKVVNTTFRSYRVKIEGLRLKKNMKKQAEGNE